MRTPAESSQPADTRPWASGPGDSEVVDLLFKPPSTGSCCGSRANSQSRVSPQNHVTTFPEGQNTLCEEN